MKRKVDHVPDTHISNIKLRISLGDLTLADKIKIKE
jgi:hypothetical protein